MPLSLSTNSFATVKESPDNERSKGIGSGAWRGPRNASVSAHERSFKAGGTSGRKVSNYRCPLSNCINSGVQRIYVLTQFNSVSLHRHIRRTYTFDPFSGGFVEILPQQTLDNSGWYQGTADAVRQHLRYIQQSDIRHVLILSGDQLYRMNYADMLTTHVQTKADVTIAAIPVHADAASGLGIMRANSDGRVEGFLEKPTVTTELDIVRTDPAWIERKGIAANGRSLLASMGIYLFDRDCLVDLLTKTDYQDFGREVFPASIRAKRVQMHLFDGYWEDIGTIRSYYQCNLDLASTTPPFELASAQLQSIREVDFYHPPELMMRRSAPVLFLMVVSLSQER